MNPKVGVPHLRLDKKRHSLRDLDLEDGSPEGVEDQGIVLLTRRPPQEPLGNIWEEVRPTRHSNP